MINKSQKLIAIQIRTIKDLCKNASDKQILIYDDVITAEKKRRKLNV